MTTAAQPPPPPTQTEEGAIPSVAGVVFGHARGGLEELLGEGATSVDEIIADMRRGEEVIAACMHEQGFEYTPQVPEPGQVEVIDAPIQGTREFAERWAYGAWSMPEDTGGGVFFTGGQAPYDAGSMSAAELEAFNEAYYGPVTETFDDGSQSFSGGCF